MKNLFNTMVKTGILSDVEVSYSAWQSDGVSWRRWYLSHPWCRECDLPASRAILGGGGSEGAQTTLNPQWRR